MWEKVQETVAWLQQQTGFEPQIGIILGSGLGSFAQEIEVQHRITYEQIPHFPTSTVVGHGGALLLGTVAGKKVMAMQGRFHYYEGYDMQTVTFPVRVMRYMGCETLVVSNASGGVNPLFQVGDIMLIRDQINFMPEHPLRGANDERFGPRFVNMSEPYRRDFIDLAYKVAAENAIQLQEGVYLGLQGPTFETLAEYRMVSRVGADCVGMSTVPEVIVARHMNMDCFGLSLITDMGNEDEIGTVSHEEVLAAAKKAEPQLRLLLRKWIEAYETTL